MASLIRVLAVFTSFNVIGSTVTELILRNLQSFITYVYMGVAR